MSRTLVRALVVAALVAVPAAVQAQVTCSITPGSPSPQICAVTGSVTVPTLARLAVTGDSLVGGALTLTSPDWDSYLATPAPTSTLSQASMVVRSNSQYAVQIRSTAASFTAPVGGSRAASTLTYAAVSGACPVITSITTAITTTNAALFNEAAATSGTTRTLCLALSWSGSLAAGDLVPGSYSLPLELTISAP